MASKSHNDSPATNKKHKDSTNIRQLLTNNTKILAKSNSKKRLMILEAIVIEQKQPSLNKNNNDLRTCILKCI